MKLAEYLEDLDPKIADNLERALDTIRVEFDERINATVEQAVAAAAEEAAMLAKQAPSPSDAITGSSVSLEAADELRLAALDIDTATSQSEILEALSRGVLRFASRVAIFVNRGQEIHGWSASGFGEADAGIKNVSLGGDVPFPLSAHLSEGSIALSSDDCASISDALGGERPSMGLLLPFVLGDQVVGTVYCDRLGEEPFSVSALQLLTYIAGETLETLPVRKRESTATLAMAGEPEVAAAVADSPADPAASMEETLAPAIEPEPIEESTATDLETARESADEYLGVAAEVPEAGLEATSSAVDLSSEPDSGIHEPDTVATRAPAVPPADPVGASATEPKIGLSSTQVAPPSDLQGPGWAFTAGDEQSESSSESEHEEAQRLARLLVTEIKLYNEEAVEEGRRDANVYSRLQEDIDRSRQIFEDRIDPLVRGEHDYFKQALVRILAGGDPALLGI